MYGKVFTQMYDGTLATKGPWQALVTFQQLLVLADKDGVVDMTAEAIARRTTIPLEIIKEGLRRLEEPDSESRSPAEDGRRITRLSENRSWGWQLVNYIHYRNIRSADDRRDYHRQYDKRYWNKTSGLTLAIQQHAQRLVREAISRGEIKITPCQVCENPDSDAHHDDYGFPLQVRFLCKTHHKQWHRENGQGEYTVSNNIPTIQHKPTKAVSSKQEAVSSKQKSKPLAPSAHALDANFGEVIIKLPLNDDTDFEVRSGLVDEFEKLYPAVDVRQTLNEVRGWN